MNSTIMTREKTEKKEYSMSIDAGNGEQDLRAELSFDRTKGTFKIVATITTKHVNLHDVATNEAVLQDVKDLVAIAIEEGVKLRLDFLSSQTGEPVVVRKKRKGSTTDIEEAEAEDIGF